MQDSDKNKRKNPWGRPDRDDRGKGPFEPWNSGGGNQGAGGGDSGDLEDLLRRAQENFRNVIPGFSGGFSLIGIGFLALVALWAASGFYTIQPGEHAVVQRFGAWSYTRTQEGLAYHWPAPIEKVTKLNVNEINTLTIGFSKDSGRMSVPDRMSMPDESLMLTSDRNIVDLNLIIQWNLKSAEDFLFNIQDQENTIKKVAESAVREVVGQMEMFPIITNRRQEVADRTKLILQKNLDDYSSGVTITQALIERAEVHPDVQNAFQEVQSAKQDAESFQNKAEAYRKEVIPAARAEANKLIQQAQAYKETAVARAQGDAKRFLSVYEAYLQGKDVTRERIYIETMETILKNAQKFIIDDKSTGGVVPYLPLGELGQKRPAIGAGGNIANDRLDGGQRP